MLILLRNLLTHPLYVSLVCLVGGSVLDAGQQLLRASIALAGHCSELIVRPATKE